MEANAPTTGQDIIVPVSASYSKLTPEFLKSLLVLSNVESAGVVLALVDSDGTVVMNRLHQGIVAPAEGFTANGPHGSGKRRKQAADQ